MYNSIEYCRFHYISLYSVFYIRCNLFKLLSTPVHILFDPNITVNRIEMIEESFSSSGESDMFQLTYTQKRKTPHVTECVPVAALITSFARIILYEELIKPYMDVYIYSDTDSSYLINNPEHPISIPVSKRLGGISDEIEDKLKLKDFIREFVTLGNKSYSFRLLQNTDISVTKCKGFSLTLNKKDNKVDLDYDIMLHLLLTHGESTVRLDQPTWFKKSPIKATIQSVKRHKVFRFSYNRKVILYSTLRTVPFGYNSDDIDEKYN